MTGGVTRGTVVHGVLSVGQVRGSMTDDHRVAKNARWYDKAGQLVGFGDLARSDLERLSGLLEADELFIVLDEYDALGLWLPSSPRTEEEIAEPGLDYLARFARVIVSHGNLHAVVDDADQGYPEGFTPILRKEVVFGA